MKLRIKWVLLVLATFAVSALSLEAANNAAVSRVGGDIKYLASDELEGRGPDTPGLQKAAEYIRSEFKKAGLKSGVKDGSYFQPFKIAIDMKPTPESFLTLRGPNGAEWKLERGKDFEPLAFGGAGKAKAEVVFAGYGISGAAEKYDDYLDADVAGKIIVIIRREPQQSNPKSVFKGKEMTPHSYIRTKIALAKKHKAAGVILVNDPFSTKSAGKDELTKHNGFGTRGNGIPFAHVSQSVLDKLLAASPLKAGDQKLSNLSAVEKYIDKNLKPLTQPLAGWTAELNFSFQRVEANVANVIGVLEGEGPKANETIVIGAHYDHLGYGPFGSRTPNVRAIHNGADDNATGTAAVMELARRFAQRKKKLPRRLVFIAFTGEERGLLGSRYYVDHPLFPLKDTIAMINFDMIGQLGKNGLQLGGVGSAKEFKALVDKLIEGGDLKVRTGGMMGGSDHLSFYTKKIPIFAFFTGMTKLYHTPKDKFETINVDGVVKVIDFAEKVAEALANLPDRPTYVKVPTRQPGGAMSYLGIVPDYGAGSDGLTVAAVNKGSPADQGGLKAGDIITKIGGHQRCRHSGVGDRVA
ncbi:MAG: hypothetical protein KatS3mg105_0140 [Gemmatales bacterium]|nr:MAG: hypothetical protein KatS3mg105_0140 [Gemmatales bacterium]